MSGSKTICPGVSGNAFSNQNNFGENGFGQTSASMPNMARNQETGKPIMGFLFSVSKTALGEYWPLYVGQNSIGCGPNSQIKLSEATVSEHHANFVIRKMQNNGESSGILAFVQDNGSTNGTMVNGESLGFAPQECKNGDIITIGENYELYFVLINPQSIGIAPKENFQPIQSFNPIEPSIPNINTNPWNNHNGRFDNPNNNQFQGFSGPKGTIGGAPSPVGQQKTTIISNQK